VVRVCAEGMAVVAVAGVVKRGDAMMEGGYGV